MRQINDTTFISDNLGDLKPVVTIGGKPIDKFIPNLNMSFHNDEFFINLNRRDKQAISATDKAEIDGTDKDIFYIDENERFKWDIEFKERPSKNSWTWELKHAEGIEFYYQGELTLEEIADGCERPLEVVGSYAVYCNKANNKYKTGKLCHIYRPFCYDINGESIYADLLIADGQLTITIDEIWLDNATYPVRLDPTIGYTSTPSSSGTNSGAVYLTTGLPSGDFIADSSGVCNTVYVYVPSGKKQTLNIGIYDNNGSPNYNLISSAQINQTWSTGWNSVTVPEFNIISGNTYYIALGLVTSNCSYGYTTASGSQCYKRTDSSTLPDPWTQTTQLSSAIAIYLEYTESAGSSLPTIINNYRQQGVM